MDGLDSVMVLPHVDSVYFRTDPMSLDIQLDSGEIFGVLLNAKTTISDMADALSQLSEMLSDRCDKHWEMVEKLESINDEMKSLNDRPA